MNLPPSVSVRRGGTSLQEGRHRQRMVLAAGDAASEPCGDFRTLPTVAHDAAEQETSEPQLHG